MELPFTSKLPMEFGPGHSISLEVTPKNPDGRFVITFLSENEILENRLDCPSSTAVFQIGFRFDDDDIAVLNTNIEGEWGPEERHSIRLIDKSQGIHIKIKPQDGHIEVHVNKAHFVNYSHRAHPSLARYINFYGEGNFVVQGLRHK